MVTLTCTPITHKHQATKGRPAMQLNPEIADTLRNTYDGSASQVHCLAQQYHVADSTIRAWARKLGLTQRSRPRPPSASRPQGHSSWKAVISTPGEEQEARAILGNDKETVDLLRTFLQEMARYPLLTAEQEFALGEQIANGDQEISQHAKQTLFLANLRLVIRVAKYYAEKAHYSLSILDLIQEGALGLLHACDIYDIRRGWRFSTVATWWIRQTVSRALKEQGRTIRLPVGMQEQILDLQQLLQATDEDLPVAVLAKRLSLSGERIQELLDASQTLYSLDAPAFGPDGDLELGQIIEASAPAPQAYAEASDLRHHLDDLLQTLRPRDRQVIILRYGLDGKGERTLEEVGKQLRVTRERIRQIETRVLLELREAAQAKQLQDYLSA